MTKNQRGEILADSTITMKNSLERARGLLVYSEAPQSLAAIFPLPLFGIFPLVHTIGMKFPIAIAFCDESKTIRSVFPAVSPGRFAFPWKYMFGGLKYLVEFTDLSKAKINVGDILSWEAS